MAKSTKSTKAPKSVKTATSEKVVVSDSHIINAYQSLTEDAKHLEAGFIIELAAELEAGSTSVRIIKASITEAIKVSGNAPTIRPAHAQFFQTFAKITDKIEDASTRSISDLLKLAQRLQTAVKVEGVDTALEGVEGIEALDEATPTLATTRAKGEKNAKAEPAPRTLEGIFANTLKDIKALQGSRSVRDLATTDLETMNNLLLLCAEIAKNSRAKANATK